MDISENVLFSELAQIDKKEEREASNRPIQERPLEPVLQKTPQFEKVNELQKYEHEIIKILLLYGNNEVEFVDFVSGEEAEDPEFQPIKKVKFNNVVSKEIYLNLHDDEVEFTDDTFKNIYYEIIYQLNQDEIISVDKLVNHDNTEVANLVTTILMEDERYVLSNWERKDIYIPSKISDLSKMVLDAIYNMRRILIQEKINSLSFINYENEETRQQEIELVMNYINLRRLLADRLMRVV
jgi:DNA primase